MTAADLASSVQQDSAPDPGLTTAAQALWFARADRWDEAHDLCQDVPDPAGAWIHAHLHRQEGDLGNAAYWYARAGREMPPQETSLASEWTAIAEALV
jgi:hypothetical protein